MLYDLDVINSISPQTAGPAAIIRVYHDFSAQTTVRAISGQSVILQLMYQVP